MALMITNDSDVNIMDNFIQALKNEVAKNDNMRIVQQGNAVFILLEEQIKYCFLMLGNAIIGIKEFDGTHITAGKTIGTINNQDDIDEVMRYIASRLQ